MIAAALLILVQATPAAVPEPEVAEIVVTARRQTCVVELADKVVSDAELDRRAAGWAAGTAVRVVASSTADVQCLAKIAFRLGEKGVRAIRFVTPSGKAAPPIKTSFSASNRQPDAGSVHSADAQPVATPRTDAAEPVAEQLSKGEREQRFFRRRATRLMMEGRCREARQLALEANETDLARDVTRLCKPAG